MFYNVDIIPGLDGVTSMEELRMPDLFPKLGLKLLGGLCWLVVTWVRLGVGCPVVAATEFRLSVLIA